MRNKVVFLLLLFMVSCSVDPEPWGGNALSDNKEKHFKPPTWIQGHWYNIEKKIHYEFTENNFIIDDVLDYSQRINTLGTEFLYSIEDFDTNKYKITIVHLSINKTIYEFELVSEFVANCNFEKTNFEEFETDEYLISKQQ